MMHSTRSLRLHRRKQRRLRVGATIVALALIPFAAGSGTMDAGPTPPSDGLVWRGLGIPIDPAPAEIANPYRGSYRWQDTTPQPSGWPVKDSYLRLKWRDLEPTAGTYDFSRIDREIVRAQARGGVFGFRIQAACTGCVGPGIAVPDYLTGLMPNGFWFRLNGTNNYAPDWNDSDYLQRLEALLQMLGERYGNDPRLGFVDVSSYGDYGEWHLHQWPYPSPTGAAPITTANAEAIVDMNVRAFPSKRLLMQHQTVTSDGKTDHDAFLYALSKYPRIGIRNDCLGSTWFSDEMSVLYRDHRVVADRWKTAPLMTEYCYQSPGSGGFQLASPQIAQFHVANIGNGNMDMWAAFSPGEQRDWMLNNARSGYRFVIDQVAMPSRLSAGEVFAVESTWANVGVTPAYTPWEVSLQFRDSAGTVVWSDTSKLDLERFLPGRRTVTDAFTLGRIAPGTYSAVLVVRDPRDYYRPLALAIEGRARDGSYPIGSVEVRGEGVTAPDRA